MNNQLVKLTVYIPIALDTDMRVEAAKQRTSLSTVAREAFELYVAKKANDSHSKTVPIEEDEDELMSFAPAVA